MQSIFEIPFFHYKIKDWSRVKKELVEQFSNSFIEKVENDKVAGGFLHTDYFNIVNTSHPPQYIQEVLRNLDPYIKSFHEDLNSSGLCGNEFSVLNVNCAWFQKQEENMNHIVHNHGAIGFSSVCYINFDSEKHSSTVFLSPFGNFMSGNTFYFQPKVKEGDIIFFPSFINHYAPINTSNSDRIIFSFNLR